MLRRRILFWHYWVHMSVQFKSILFLCTVVLQRLQDRNAVTEKLLIINDNVLLKTFRRKLHRIRVRIRSWDPYKNHCILVALIFYVSFVKIISYVRHVSSKVTVRYALCAYNNNEKNLENFLKFFYFVRQSFFHCKKSLPNWL